MTAPWYCPDCGHPLARMADGTTTCRACDGCPVCGQRMVRRHGFWDCPDCED